MSHPSTDAADLLKAAGFAVMGYGTGRGPDPDITFDARGVRHTMAVPEVAAWLKAHGLYPSAEMVAAQSLRRDHDALAYQLSRLSEGLSAVRHEVSRLAGDSLALCYADDGVLWFTSDMTLQTGDDWNDAPYDCNAGAPYAWRHGLAVYLLVRAQVSGVAVEYAHERGYRGSVDALNNARAPWCYVDNLRVDAGASLSSVRTLVESRGGKFVVEP